MKTRAFYTYLLLSMFITLNAAASKIVKQEKRNVASFNQIKVRSAFVVHLSQDAEQSVVVETEEEYIDKIKTTVKNGVLHIELTDLQERNNRDLKTMNVYITIPVIKSIEASAAVRIKMQTPINNKETVSFKLSGASSMTAFTLKCRKCELELSGASKLNVDLTADEVDANVSGTSNLTISGKVDVADIDGSGASKIDIRNFTCNKGDFQTSGASKLEK